jgi:hypothetical protein
MRQKKPDQETVTNAPKTLLPFRLTLRQRAVFGYTHEVHQQCMFYMFPPAAEEPLQFEGINEESRFRADKSELYHLLGLCYPNWGRTRSGSGYGKSGCRRGILQTLLCWLPLRRSRA